jgi:glycopeptide antibiotics resistance protein
MTLDFFPFPFLIGSGFLIILWVILRIRKRSFPYLFCFSLFWIYLLLVIGVTLFPMPLPGVGGAVESRESARYILSRVNLTLFHFTDMYNPDPTFVFFREIVANIVLTIPFGFGLSFIARFKPRIIPYLALALGIGIEIAQLIMCLLVGSNYRGVNINDALMNALGVLVGYWLFKVFARQYVSFTLRFRLQHKGLLAYLLMISQKSQ